MQPRTRVQKNVVKLSKQLRNPSEKQKAYAFKHCFTHSGYRSKRGVISCLECGYQWAGEYQLEETINGVVCPKCGQRLKVVDTRNRICREKVYFTILSTCNGYQILRHFLVKMSCKVKQPAQYSISEVVQQWIDSKGKIINIGRKRCMSAYYYDVWNMYSDMEIRQNNQWGVYDIYPFKIYPRKRVIPLLKRNGFTGDFHNVTPVSFLSAILRNVKMETLLKTKQIEVLKHAVVSRFDIDKYWNSIKICVRNNYTISDVSMWGDYIDLLVYFGKDTHNARYVCPTNLQAEHDKLVRKKTRQIEREKLEKAKRKAIEHENKYRELKQNFFGIFFTDGTIDVKVLESVREFAEEGVAMHHCVFANEYYLKPDSLILSATINGKRIETVEVSLKTHKVVQSRGACNQNTEYHQRIVNLVNRNMKLITNRIVS